jgi:hypothetical protein
MQVYTPYISDKPDKKYFIITPNGNKIYFGAVGYEHYTDGHLNEKRRQLYEKRHMKRENWNDPNTSGFWSYRYLWLYKTKKEALQNIRKFLKGEK